MKQIPVAFFLVFFLFNYENDVLTDELSPGHTITIETGEITTIFVDNTAFGVHRKLYNGLAFLSHKADTTNFFVPAYAGLNFEHIYDGEKWWEPSEALFEPRYSSMSIKKISERKVELHQSPSNLHKLESWTSFTVSGSHYIDMEFTCIPRKETYGRGYIGLFWASYINTTSDIEYYFIGHEQHEKNKKWVKYATPSHNVNSTVKYESDTSDPTFVDEHPPRLYNNYSPDVYSYPFYYGRKGEMVFIIMFDQSGSLRFSHSPVGGTFNSIAHPAWDFQYLIYDYNIGEKYGFKARVVYKIFVSIEDVIKEYEKWSGRKVIRPVD